MLELRFLFNYNDINDNNDCGISGVIFLLKRYLLFVLIFFSIFSISVEAFAEAYPDLSAEAYILVEMETGQVLAEKNADQRRSPASTTKIMTALIALERADLDKEMTASEYAINSIPYDYVTAGIRIGETLKFKHLLDLMMITSANEASNIIAENIAEDGTLQGFTQLMNEKAKELGLNNTNFTNANGTEDENHYSTARDLANLAREAMKNETFREVVGRKEFELPDTNLRKKEQWQTGHLTYTNQLLNSRSSYYSQITGIKTGYTDNAGMCLVSSAVNPDGLELVAVVLGTKSYDILFRESQQLLEYGYKNYSIRELAKKGEYVDRVEVEDAVDGKKLEIITNNGFEWILPANDEILNEKLESEIKFNKPDDEPFKAPIEAGQVVGVKEYRYDGEIIGEVELVAKKSIEKTTFAIIRDKYKEIVSNERFIFGLKAAGILLVLIIILSYILKAINHRNRRNRRYRYTRPKHSRKRHYRY
ncbi:MAG: D-alanyl-D-alanine carboxypeptidase [Clostridiaceae bacterium]|nr:D-alanyl-D-alanine carboxypeptidase [Clostridiaceae bacterium]